MANRSLFPDNVKVSGRHLQQESANRSGELKDAAAAAADFGVVSGFAVTVNGTNNQTVDVAVGVAYCPRGDKVTKTSATTGLAITNTLATKNYVLVVYDELQSQPESHESNGSTLNTKAVEASRVVVMTESAYNALPQTVADLSLNDKDRATLIAIVTGTGGALSSGNIQNATSYPQSLTASATGIAGVTILQVGQSVPVGTGAITLAIGPTTLAWRSPGDGVAGTPVAITATGVYTLTSSSVGSILVSVTFSQLPTVGSTNSATISTVYTETVRRFTAVDERHRSLLGTGLPSSTNPHGMTLDDLSAGAAGTLEQHQDVMHSNGILRGSSANFLSTAVNTATAPDSLLIGVASPGDAVYVNGRRLQDISGSATITFGDGTATAGLYGIYMTQDGVLVKSKRLDYPAVPTIISRVIISDIENVVPGNYNLTMSAGGLLSFGGGPAVQTVVGPQVNTYTLHTANLAGYVRVRVAVAAFAALTDIITVNAPLADDNLLLSNIAWSGSATGFLGVGFGGASSPNSIIDRRVYGTIDVSRTNEQSITEVTKANRALDLHGPVFKFGDKRYFEDNTITPTYETSTGQKPGGHRLSATGLSLTISGGDYFVSGVFRFVPATTLTLVDNTTNLIYLDLDGVYKQSTSAWHQIINAYGNSAFLRLYSVVTAGGVTDITGTLGTAFLTPYVDAAKNAPGGVVGIRSDETVKIIRSANTTGALVEILDNTSSIAATALSVQSANGKGLSITAGLQALFAGGLSQIGTPAFEFVDIGAGSSLTITSSTAINNLVLTNTNTTDGIAAYMSNDCTNLNFPTLTLNNASATGRALSSVNGGFSLPQDDRYDFNSARTRYKFISQFNIQGAVTFATFTGSTPSNYDAVSGGAIRISAQFQLPAGAIITRWYLVYSTTVAPTNASTVSLKLYNDTAGGLPAGTVLATNAALIPGNTAGVPTRLDLGAVTAYTPITGTSTAATSGWYEVIHQWPAAGAVNFIVQGFKVEFTYTEVSGLEL